MTILTVAFLCVECGASWNAAAYADAVAKAARFSDEAVTLMEDGYCPECGKNDVVEEVE